LDICAPPLYTCVHNFDGACNADAATPWYICELPLHVCLHILDGASHACVIQLCCKFCSNAAIIAFITGGVNISSPRAKQVGASLSLARAARVSNLIICRKRGVRIPYSDAN
jgi:hypothetical protein